LWGRSYVRIVVMYIEKVPNRNSPPAVLLRESYREDGKVKKRTVANLTYDFNDLMITMIRFMIGNIILEI
jgi:hypothetical protein